LFALLRRGVLDLRVLGIAFGGFLIGVSSIAYLFWRAWHPGLVQWPRLGPDTILHHLLGAQYRGYLGRFAPNPIHQHFLSAHIYPWLAPALLALLAVPFARWAAVPRVWRIAVAAAGAVQTAYVFSYGVPDPSPYFLPVLALGLAVLPAWLAHAVPGVRRRGAWIAGAAALALAVTCTVWVRRGLDRADTYQRFDGFMHRIWTSVPFEEGFVIFGDDMVHRLWEYQLLRDEKPRVIALNPALLYYPRFHAAFLARHGFDPLEGVPSPPPVLDDASTQALFAEITRRINYASPLPVLVIDRTGPSSRLLNKSAGAAPPARR
jgi:hypothetical protein